MTSYRYTEETGHTEHFQAADDDAAIERAKGLLRGGDWGQDALERTIWVHADLYTPWDDEDDEERHVPSVRVQLDPDAPRCTQSEHDWEDGQPYSSGGGVAYTDTCRHCGLRRTTDTWAQDPSTGEQGLGSIAYERAQVHA